MSYPSPPPPPPAPKPTSDKPGDPKLFAFLVGINDYQNVSNLRGCVKDIEDIEGYLRWRYHVLTAEGTTQKRVATPSTGNNEKITLSQKSYSLEHFPGYESLDILKITDQSATRENIIDHFLEFLGDAGEKDKVLFYFSGHGVEATTAEVFRLLENGKDQCFMCHDYVNDNGIPTNLLADKEIAQLLRRLASGENGTPHIVVGLDTCHSGGGSREEILGEPADDAIIPRVVTLPSGHLSRPLSSYFGYEEGDQFVPPPPHVVFSACNNLQLAGETINGGIFTQQLLEVLFQANGHINYADLHAKTRFRIRRQGLEQTPQFDVFGEAQAYSLFLDGRPDGDPDRYEVYQHVRRERNAGTGEQVITKWVVKCGAIHHLPVRHHQDQPIDLDIYYYDSINLDPVAKGRIVNVGPVESTLEIIEDISFTQVQIAAAARGEVIQFYGIINHFPAPIEYVLIHGNEETAQELVNNWTWQATTDNILPVTDPDHLPAPSISIKADIDAYRITDELLGVEIDADYLKVDLGKGHITQDLRKIVHWRRMVALIKDRSTLLESNGLQDKVKLSINIIGRQEWSTGEQDELLIEANNDNDLIEERLAVAERIYQYLPTVTITRASGDDQKLFTYLFEMDQHYRIRTILGEQSIESASQTLQYGSFDENYIGLGEEEKDFTYYFKLIVTTQELDYHQLEQEGITGSKLGGRRSRKPDKGFDDWMTVTKKVRIYTNESAEERLVL